MESYIKNRLPKSYPNSIRDNIVLMSIDKRKSFPIGTMSYSYALYPSDIDIFEVYDKGSSREELIMGFCKSIQELVGRILQKQYYWILEVKCGMDTRFDFQFNSQDSNNRIGNLIGRGLFNTEEVSVLNSGNEVAINDLLRSKSVLRWSAGEILSGRKLLPGSIFISLQKAVSQGTQTNIECIAVINGKFVDISNFFVLIFVDSYGVEHPINLPEMAITNHHTFQIANLKNAIANLVKEGPKRDFYKVTKRLWSLGRFTHDHNMISKLTSFINSIYALAGQKRSEIKTIMNIVKHTYLDGIPLGILKNQINSLKLPISSIIELGIDNIRTINGMLDSIDYNPNYQTIIVNLTEIYKILDNFVQINSLNFLRNSGFYPLPKYLLI